MRPAPTQSTATLETLSTSITVGNISAISRPARMPVAVSSSLAMPNRARSSGSRTNARTTRMPLSCSRSTRLTVSMRLCIARNCGTSRETISPIATASVGTLTASSQLMPASSRIAMTIPPTHMIGAATISVQVITTSICTCCTSLVVRVISDGGPNRVTSRALNRSTWPNRVARRSRPNDIAARAPKNTAATEAAICTKLIASIQPPMCMM